MMKTQDLIESYVHDSATTGKANSVYIDGKTLYSYGKHFPLAVRFNNHFYINSDKYSRTTSKHQGYLKRALDDQLIVFTKPTDELIKMADNPYIV